MTEETAEANLHRRRMPLLAGVGMLVLALLCGLWVATVLEANRLQAQREAASLALDADAATLQRELEQGRSAAYLLAATLDAAQGDLGALMGIIPTTFAHYNQVDTIIVAQDATVLIVSGRGDTPRIVTQVLADSVPRPDDGAGEIDRHLIVRGLFAGSEEPLLVAQKSVVSNSPVVSDLSVLVVVRLRNVVASTVAGDLSHLDFGYAVWEDTPAEAGTLLIAPPHPLLDPVAATVPLEGLTLRLEAAPNGGWPRSIFFARDLLVAVLVALMLGRLVTGILRRPDELQQEIARRTATLAQTTRQLEAEIVERRQIEDALRRSEARLRAIIESAADGILTFDADGLIEGYNPSACRILGIDAGALVGMRIQELVPPDERTTFAGFLERLTSGDGENDAPWLYEVRGIGRNAVDVRIAFGRAPVGEGWLFTAILHDLTETRRAEELLRAVHERLYYVISKAPVVVFAFDANGIFTLSEGSGLGVIGRSRGEMVGRSIFEVYHDNPAVLHAVHEVLDGKPQNLEVQEGRVVFDSWYFPTLDREGHVTGVTGVAHDVTRRKQAEDALTSVLDTVGDSVVVADELGQIVMANRQVEGVFGYRPDELIGRNIAELAAPHFVAAQEGGMPSFRTDENGLAFNRRLQIEGLHRSGRIFPMEIFVGKTQIGSQLHFTASLRDITQEKELEKLRDDFISAVSHELRTPLASVMGWLETLLEGRPGPLTETQVRFLKIAYASAERLNRQVEEILTVSRINRGTLRLEKLPFDPSQAVSAAVDMLDSIAAERDIAIIVNDNWPQRAMVVGDRDRFDQVLANLLSNAVKFSPNGGVVEVRSDKVNEEWRLEVADHGIGIPQDELPRIFQRFYRGSNATQAQIQGTGLGLYICKAIVEGHEGRIGIQSDVGVGTKVWFSVPVATDGGI